MRVWAALLVVMTSGCLAVAPPGPIEPAAAGHGAPAGDDRETLPWELIDCDFVWGSISVPAAHIEPLIPPGLRLVTTSPAGTGLTTNLNLEFDRCATGSGVGEVDVDVSYHHATVPVVPDSDLAIPGFTGGYTFHVGQLMDQAERRTWFTDRGLQVMGGQVTHQPHPNVHAAAAQTDGWGTVEVQLVARPNSSIRPGGSFAVFSMGDEGMFRWRSDWQVTDSFASGTGIVTFEPGSRLAEIAGAPIAVGQNFMAGRWDYTNGFVEFPVPQ